MWTHLQVLVNQVKHLVLQVHTIPIQALQVQRIVSLQMLAIMSIHLSVQVNQVKLPVLPVHFKQKLGKQAAMVLMLGIMSIHRWALDDFLKHLVPLEHTNQTAVPLMSLIVLQLLPDTS